MNLITREVMTLLLISTGSDNNQTHRHAHSIVKASSLSLQHAKAPPQTPAAASLPSSQPASQLFAPSEPGPRDLGYTRASPGRAHDSRLDLSFDLTRAPCPPSPQAYKSAFDDIKRSRLRSSRGVWRFQTTHPLFFSWHRTPLHEQGCN